nr:hypothetical protein [Tanacetum cinerariifolium]
QLEQVQVFAAAFGEHVGGHFEGEDAEGLDFLHAHQQEALGLEGIGVEGSLPVVVVGRALPAKVLGIAGHRGFKIDYGVGLVGLIEHEVGAQLAERAGSRLAENSAALGKAVFEQAVEFRVQLHALYQPPDERISQLQLIGGALGAAEYHALGQGRGRSIEQHSIVGDAVAEYGLAVAQHRPRVAGLRDAVAAGDAGAVGGAGKQRTALVIALVGRRYRERGGGGQRQRAAECSGRHLRRHAGAGNHQVLPKIAQIEQVRNLNLGLQPQQAFNIGLLPSARSVKLPQRALRE